MTTETFQCEDCSAIFRLERVDVYANGTIRPPGRYIQRGGVWYNENGYEEPPTSYGYLIDGRIYLEPVCECGRNSLRAEIAAPAIGGERAKLTETVANDLMQRQGLTDMRDNLRPGDISAPPLPPPLQQAADTMFSRNNPGRQSIAGVKALPQMPYEQSGRRGMAMLQNGIRTGGIPDIKQRQR
jgi:hypothetical protein